jgi:hypothetical protein
MFAAKQSDLTPAQRAHIRRTLWLLLAYAVILPPLVWLQANRHISHSLSLLMAVAASLPVRIAIATNATMGAAVVWGFLQAFGVMPLFETYWIPFVWVVMQGAFGCVAVFSRGRPDA